MKNIGEMTIHDWNALVGDDFLRRFMRDIDLWRAMQEGDTPMKLAALAKYDAERKAEREAERAENLRVKTEMLTGTVEAIAIEDAHVMLTYTDGRKVRIEAASHYDDYGNEDPGSIDVVPA